jgi:Ca2+-binding RTX toxin-like protein
VGKPSRPSGFTVTGTDGSDILELPSGATILNTTIDGRRGNDTLDLSNYSSAGVYVRIEYGMAKAKSLVIDQPFTGIFTASSLNGLPRVEGSIRNVENLIGTSGNDFLFVNTLGGVPKMIDGDEGNDVVNSLGGSATLIGGTGSDWLVSYWENNIIIGGDNDGDLSISDGERDVFYLGSAPTVLDFEVGTDHILVELTSGQAAASVYAPGAIVWVSEDAGSSLYVNGVREVTLANVDVATAQSILFGVVVSPINNVVEGGPGDDMLFAGGHTTVTRVVVGSGDDVVINFDLALDTLAFEDGLMPIWSNTIINGATALVATYAGGSLTLQGLSMDDVGSIMIDGSVGTLADTENPTPSAWSLPSDFL